jgi:hypothetical protein
MKFQYLGVFGTSCEEIKSKQEHGHKVEQDHSGNRANYFIT